MNGELKKSTVVHGTFVQLMICKKNLYKGCVQATFTSVRVYRCPFSNSPLYGCPVLHVSVVQVSILQMSGCTNVRLCKCPIVHESVGQLAIVQLSSCQLSADVHVSVAQLCELLAKNQLAKKK